MASSTEWKTVKTADGAEMRVFVAKPESAPRANLLLFQEAFGVNAHIRDVAQRFANEGYLVGAPELYHRTAKPGFEAAYKDFGEVMPHMQAITADGLTTDINATQQVLKTEQSAHPEHFLAIGFCMGGRVAFFANSMLKLKAAASFYGGGIAPVSGNPGLLNRVPKLSSPMLFCWGGKDQHIGTEQPRQIADALRAAGKPFVTTVFSTADHGFFCDARPSYHPESAKEAWALTLAFFANKIA